MSALDDRFMGLALRLARRGFGQSWPNPSVGCVLTNGENEPVVIARGWTQPGGRPHAETFTLDQAQSKAQGGTLYVTLEPCVHHGKTPPCTEAIIRAGIARVIYGIGDPDPRVSGTGLTQLKSAGIEISQTSSLLQNEARWCVLGHILRTESKRPFVTLKLAMGADGRMAPGDGTPSWVTNAQSRAFGHLMRAQADAILVGIGTVRADNPRLNCRLPGLEKRSPIRVVLDSRLSIQPSSYLVTSARDIPVFIFCRQDAPPAKMTQLNKAGVEVIPSAVAEDGEGLSLKSVLEILAKRGITRLMVEGGPSVAKAFVKQHCVDEIVLFYGADAVGPQGLDALAGEPLELITHSPHFQLARERPLISDTMRIFRRLLN